MTADFDNFVLFTAEEHKEIAPELQKTKASIAKQDGHLYGPPAPHIAFWYGENYLGEVRGHPSHVEAARTKLRNSIIALEGYTPENRNKVHMLLCSRKAKLYCGMYAQDVEIRLN